MDILKVVSKLIRSHKTRNPFEIIKGLNVILVLCPLTGVRGFYQYFQRNNIIYIDENLSDEERRFVCAHELGHMLLHKKFNTVFMDTRTQFRTDVYENQADKFAMHLLVSNESLLENQHYTINQLSRLLGYEEELIKLRVYGC